MRLANWKVRNRPDIDDGYNEVVDAMSMLSFGFAFLVTSSKRGFGPKLSFQRAKRLSLALLLAPWNRMNCRKGVRGGLMNILNTRKLEFEV